MLLWLALIGSALSAPAQDVAHESARAVQLDESEAIRPAYERLRDEFYLPTLDHLWIPIRDLEIVVRDTEGEPVAGAAVALSGPSLTQIEGSPMHALRSIAHSGPDWEAIVWRAKAPAGCAEVARLAEPVDPTAVLDTTPWQTDASGRLTLPIPESGRVQVAAGHDGRVGLADYEPDSSPTSSIEVILRQDPSIEVSVTTPSGRALADVPIGIVAAAHATTDKYAKSRLLASTRTDASGRARLRFASDDEADKQRFEAADVTLLVAGYEHLGVPIRSLAREPIKLVVPEPAWLEVTREEIGRHHTLPIAIALVGSASPVAADHNRAPRGYDIVELPTSGAVTLGPIGPGADIQVFSTSPWRTWHFDQRYLDLGTPFESGERRAFTLPAVTLPPTLEVRLVRADGTPDANRQVWVAHRDPPPDIGMFGGGGEPILVTPPQWVTTDDDGRFELMVAPGWLSRDSISQLMMWSADPSVEADTQASMLTIPSLQGVAHLDLGFVVLQTDNFIASGRVVDAQGRGVADLQVGARTARPATGELNRSFREPDINGELSLAVEWLPCQTNADGRFELRGPATPEPIRLMAWDDRPTPRFETLELRDFERGNANFEIVMPSRGGIAGALDVPPETALQSLRVRAYDADGDRKSESQLGNSGEFEVGGLLSGQYELRLETSGGAVVEELGSHQVQTATVSRPDTLDQVALGATLYHYSFEVPAEHDFPRRSPTIEFRRVASEGKWHSIGSLEEGQTLRCSLPEPLIEVRLQRWFVSLLEGGEYKQFEHLGRLVPGAHVLRP